MKCNNCGTENADGQQYCQGCGAALYGQSNMYTQQNQNTYGQQNAGTYAQQNAGTYGQQNLYSQQAYTTPPQQVVYNQRITKEKSALRISADFHVGIFWISDFVYDSYNRIYPSDCFCTGRNKECKPEEFCEILFLRYNYSFGSSIDHSGNGWTGNIWKQYEHVKIF